MSEPPHIDPSQVDPPDSGPAGSLAKLDVKALDLFTDSLDQPAGTRHEWLANQCAHDPDLLARVLRLLDADRAGANFLDSPLKVPLPDRIGERLGSFEITGDLAAGGMSTVYKGRRADGTFEQQVAIKLIRTDLFCDDALRRFHAERQILASMEHPGIARIIDGGSAQDGTPYVVMEFVDGQPITQYSTSNSLDIDQRLQLFQQVCQALGAAHARGVVHRDLKPGNILVNAEAQVRLIDFGIAKVLRKEGNQDDLPLTRIESQMYTPEYASPEQVRAESVGVGSDVYSLGVLLYELLSGMRPYQVSQLSPAAIEQMVCHTIPVDPSIAVSQRRASPPAGLPAKRQLKRRLNGDLDRIVMTAMRKETMQRYHSAEALADDIDRYLNGQAVVARGASRWYRARKFITRHPGASIGSAATIFVLLTALIVVSKQVVETRQQAARAESAKQFLIDMIGRADPYANTQSATLAAALSQAIPGIELQFGKQPELEAEIRFAIGFALSGQGEMSAARSQLEQALSIYELLDNRTQRAGVLKALAGVSWDEADFAGSDAQFKQALELVEADSSVESLLTLVQTLIDYCGLLPHMDKPAQAIVRCQQAQALIESEPDVQIGLLDKAVLFNNLAVAYDMQEDYEHSVEAYKRSISLHQEANPDGSADLGTALGNLGMTYEYAGQMNLAIDYVKQASDMQSQQLGSDHPQAVLMRYNLGSMQKNAGDLQNAIKNMRAAVDAAKQAYPAGHLYSGRFNQRLAEAYVEAGEMDLARRHAQAALDIYNDLDDINSDWIAATRQILQR